MLKPYWVHSQLVSSQCTCSLLVVIGQVDKELVGERRKTKRKSHSSRRSQYVVKSVDDITKEDLDNIAYRSKDKIWDKENVSHTRLLLISYSWYNTILYYTVRFAGLAWFITAYLFVPPGQLMSPVQTEDSGHQDSVSQWFLCGGQRSVLWTVS